MNNHELCQKHGITIHVIGDVYGKQQDGEPIPPEELNMFFVATPAAAFDAALVEAIPVAATVDEAEALAVRYLDLK